MPRRSDVPCDLLFGLLALQNSMVSRDQLVVAFTVWTAAPGRSLAELLSEHGALRPEHRPLLDALVDAHLELHGGDLERSLAALHIGRSTRESLAGAGGPAVEATLARVGNQAGADAEADRTTTYAVGSATADGQRFRVLRPHAQGGLGAVFVALDEELHREVALKQILDGHADDPISRERFLLEAEITGGLEHPGIVPVYGLGTYGDGRPYYAMRFIRGDSLKEAIVAFHADASLKKEPGRRSLELRKLLRRFLDVCNAVEYAHGRGVLHRDLKPGNIIVGKHGETLVVDWGLAKASGRADPDSAAGERPLTPSSSSGSAETLPGAAIGTPSYMSPEQARGDLQALGTTSDVYSLGATLYCLLSGRPPFEGTDIGAVLRLVERGDFRPPRQVDPTIARALEAICLKAMATNPSGRYPRARALADDLERWMADEPVSAWREPISRRAGRWARRHRPLVAGAAMVLVSAIVALSVGAVLINRERAKAEANFRQARAAVDKYFTRVSESKLLNVPNLFPLRKELLGDARTYYEQFLHDHGDDLSVRAEAAEAWYRLGFVEQFTGSRAESARYLERSAAMYEALAREHPDEPRYAYKHAMALNDLAGQKASLGQSYESLRIYQQSLTMRERLAREHPAVAEYQKELAIGLGNVGVLQLRMSRPKEALALFERERQVLQTLVRDHPKVVDYRFRLATSYMGIAWQAMTAKRPGEALANACKARELFEQIVREEPQWQEYASLLGGSYRLIGQVQQRLNRQFEAAADSYRQAIDVLGRLAADNPTVPAYRLSLGYSLCYLGQSLRALGRQSEAGPPSERALEIFARLAESEDIPLYDRACVLALCGELVTSGRAEPTVEEQSRRTQYADRAVEILRRSITGGYRNLDHLKTDPDLDSLRERADFQEVMAHVESRVNAQPAPARSTTGETPDTESPPP
jgi:serine/threonine-protein kinase